MRAVLLMLAVCPVACVLDWSASWPDAQTPRPEAGVEAGRDCGARELGGEGPPPLPEIVWVDIAPGDLVIGSPADVPCRILPGETPQNVRLAHAYQLASTETTQGQFLARMGYSNLRGARLDRPIAKVTWHEATAFCNALSQRESITACYRCQGEREKVQCSPLEEYAGDRILSCPGFRLPTEAEWEQGYRAGSEGPLYLPVRPPAVACQAEHAVADAIGWYAANSGGESHSVAGKSPNAWGLYDLAGNVSEWTLDERVRGDLSAPLSAIDPVGSQGPYHALRGGSFLDPASHLRAAARSPILESFAAVNLGFRCARTIPRLFSGVIHKMLMPSVTNEFALDIDGTGPKNALGTMMAMMNTLGLRFQETLDNDLREGRLIVLAELHADSHLTGKRAIGQVHLGEDIDGDYSNNFDGSTLAIKGNSPPGLYTKGSILKSTISLRGKVPFPLPLTLAAPATKVLTLAAGRIEAKYTGKAVMGIIGGGVTRQDFDGILLAAVVETLDWAIGPTNLKLSDRIALAKALDLDGDGHITLMELQADPIYYLMQPDLDLDGDKKLDAYSMAAAFEAVPCTIQR